MPNPSTVAMDMESEAEAMGIIAPKPSTTASPDQIHSAWRPPPVGDEGHIKVDSLKGSVSLKSEEVRHVDPVTGGAKGQKDAWLSLVPPRFKNYLSQVYRFGAKKYTRDNYLRGYNWSLSYDAMQRHIDATLEGEWLDDESGLPHLAHAAWHCATLILFHDHNIGTDDRIDFTGQRFLPEETPTPDAEETVLKGS